VVSTADCLFSYLYTQIQYRMSCKFHKAIFHALLAVALYAVAPFIGVILSMLILGERPNWIFFVALAIMLLGTYVASIKTEE